MLYQHPTCQAGAADVEAYPYRTAHVASMRGYLLLPLATVGSEAVSYDNTLSLGADLYYNSVHLAMLCLFRPSLRTQIVTRL